MTLPVDWQTAEYGSHWPVLHALFESFPIRRVLELGSGLYSTNLFLREPKVQSLVSIENNPDWADENVDERHTLKLVEGKVADHLPDLSEFDLVFIDDDPVRWRTLTIRRVLAQKHPFVVVHDTDYPDFKAVVRKHQALTFTAQKPWTSLIWPK